MQTKNCAQGAGMGVPARDSSAALQMAMLKRARLATELALRGYELKQVDGNTFIVTRWGLARSLESLQAVDGFAQQVGVQHG